MLDYIQAAKLTLKNNQELADYFKNEEDITFENIDSLSGAEIYEITECGLCIGYLQLYEKLATGEQAFRLSKNTERAKVGDRHFRGENKTYVVKGTKIDNIIFDALDIEGHPELEHFEMQQLSDLR